MNHVASTAEAITAQLRGIYWVEAVALKMISSFIFEWTEASSGELYLNKRLKTVLTIFLLIFQPHPGFELPWTFKRDFACIPDPLSFRLRFGFRPSVSLFVFLRTKFDSLL